MIKIEFEKLLARAFRMLLGEDGGAVTSASKRRFLYFGHSTAATFEKTKGS